MRMRIGRTGTRLSKLASNKKALGAASLTVADVIGKAIAFLITPYLANRMGAEEFGVLNLYVSITQILTFVISLGGAGLLAVEYIRNGYTSARRLRAANLRLALVVAAILLATSLVISWIAPTAVPVVSGILIVAVSFMQALNVLELSYYRGAQSYSVAVIGQFAFAILNVLLTVMAFELQSPTATNRLLCIALAGSLIQAFYALELRRKHFEPGDKALRRTQTAMVVKFGLSIFVHQASHWIRSSVDRFVVMGYLGLAVTGVYSVAVTLAMVISIFFTAISQQLQPFLYRRLMERDFAGFRRVQAWFIGAVLLVTGVYYALLIVTFHLLFNIEYDGAKVLLPALLGGTAAQSIYYIFTHAAFYERRGGQISTVTASALMVHLLGLGALALLKMVTPANVALVFFASSVVGMVGMAYLSLHIVRQLRSGQPLVAHSQEGSA